MVKALLEHMCIKQADDCAFCFTQFLCFTIHISIAHMLLANSRFAGDLTVGYNVTAHILFLNYQTITKFDTFSGFDRLLTAIHTQTNQR